MLHLEVWTFLVNVAYSSAGKGSEVLPWNCAGCGERFGVKDSMSQTHLGC